MAARIAQAADDFDAGLSDDLNTAQALAAMYDLVREANIAMDKGEFVQSDVAPAQEFVANFDQVFAIVEDNDAEKLKALGYDAGEDEPTMPRSKNWSRNGKRRGRRETSRPPIASAKSCWIVV